MSGESNEALDLFESAVQKVGNNRPFSNKDEITHYANVVVITKPDENGQTEELSLPKGIPLKKGRTSVENALITKTKDEYKDVTFRLVSVNPATKANTEEVANI